VRKRKKDDSDPGEELIAVLGRAHVIRKKGRDEVIIDRSARVGKSPLAVKRLPVR